MPPIDQDVEDRFQKFIAEAPGSRREPKTDEEREALAKLLAQQQRLKTAGGQYDLPKSSGGFVDTVEREQPMRNAGASNMSIQPGGKR